ncbi:TIGR03792 family protein [Nostoc sp. CCY0012]|uniref:TIGR03792 family protein n=1 Tax=Nostoc sp. CCY0012 TaxID=1056123 RepID=UPI0039C6E606
MVIELLKFKVAPEQREHYIQQDAEIWTTALAKYPGFLGKEVWINPNDPTELILIVRWATREQWKAIPVEDLQAIEAQFTQAMGESYPIVELAEYQVRKFPQLMSN